MIPMQVPAVEIGTEHVVSVVLTAVVAYLLAKGVSLLLSSLAERFVEHRIRLKMLVPVLKAAIYATAVYVVLGPVFELTSTQLLAFSGLLGAALGFGLKDFFANALGGVVIILLQPYEVGDKIAVRDHYGEVTNIGIRATEVVTPNDSLVSVPNYLAFSEAVSNANAGVPEMMVVVEVYVDAASDIDQATTIVEEALLTSRYVYLDEDCDVTVLVEDGPYYRTVTGKAYVNDLRNEFQFQSDVTERVLKAFDDADIETPDIDVARTDVA